MFDDEYHVVSKYKIPVEDAKDWCIGIDYGTGNATVFLLMMKTYNDRIYAVKEYYYAGRKEAQENDDYSLQKTDREFAEDLKSFIIDNYNLTGKGYRNDIEIFVDPAAASFKVELRKHFRMKVKNADNEVIDGVRKVATRLSLGELFISEDCPNLIREFHNYMWDEKAQMRGEDKVVKRDDHCCTGSTLVFTENGYKRIDTLVGQEGKVWTIDDEGNKCLKKFSNVRKTQENAKVIKITFENGDSMVLTPDHLVLTQDGWKEAMNIDYEDEIVTI